MPKITELEPHFTAAEVAEKWKVHPSTVRRICRDRPDVLKIAGPRGRVVLWIPASTLERIQREGQR